MKGASTLRTHSLSLTVIVCGMLAASPASAQYFDYTPRLPDVEVDLSVLDDGRGQQDSRANNPGRGPVSRHIETAPLPPLNTPPANAEGFMPPVRSVPSSAMPPAQAAPIMPSPYERSRVVERIELESPVSRGTPASPFNPPAVVTPPKPRPEAPRTAPAVVVKPQPLSPLDGGAPMVISGTVEDDSTGIELPAQIVSDTIKKTPAPEEVTLPVRKPETVMRVPLPMPETIAAKVTAPAKATPVTVIDNPPAPPVMPAGIRSPESVIADLYTLPTTPIEGGEELAALPLMANEQAPPPVDAAPEDDTAPAVGLLIFDGASVTLDAAMRDTLADVVKRMNKEDGSRLLIRAYAAGGDGSKASARNISLSRALSVRAHLMDEGLATKDIDVRAMGRDTSVSPLDRVDLVLQ